LTQESFATLDQVAASLLVHEDVRLEIGGHTDATGGRAHNVELSIRRAESVRQYLIQKGVAADRLEAKGYGPDRPIASNRTREGRAANRRVELNRLDE
jgi:OOP family OmpA-OmpF porin